MIYFYYIFLFLLLFLFILKIIKVILYYFGGKYKSLGINSKVQSGDGEKNVQRFLVLKLILYIIFSVPKLHQIVLYFITFSAYVLFTILLYGAFFVSSPASVIINCSLSKLSSFNTGVSFQASMSL